MTGPAADAGASKAASSSPATAPGWEEPRPASPPGAPVLSVDGFEGPLDWLVETARARKLDLSRLSILALVEAFGAALTAALENCERNRPPLDLARWADWLTLAAALVQMRSNLLLLPDAPAAQTARAEAEALRRALAGRAEAAAAADWLERQPQLGWAVFARGRPEAGVPGLPGRIEEGVDPAPAVAGDITALLRACLVALRMPAGADAWQPARPVFWRVADAVARIGEVLDSAPGGVGAELGACLPRIGPGAPEREVRCRAAVASTFIAGLELARDGGVLLKQDRPWTAIQVQQRRPNGASETDR